MRSGGRSAYAPSGRIAAAPPRSAMKSRRLTIASAKTNHVLKNASTDYPSAGPAHRPLAGARRRGDRSRRDGAPARTARRSSDAFPVAKERKRRARRMDAKIQTGDAPILRSRAHGRGSIRLHPLKVARENLDNIHSPSKGMVVADIYPVAENVHELRLKAPDTEKITINLGYVDLGHVDLMVQEGFYSNRTDFIRTAIRNQLERHADVVKQSTARKSLDLGLRNYSREDLEAAQRAGEMLHINVLGLASISQDVTPELARATIASVSVLGALHASAAVKAALADRTR